MFSFTVMSPEEEGGGSRGDYMMRSSSPLWPRMMICSLPDLRITRAAVILYPALRVNVPGEGRAFPVAVVCMGKVPSACLNVTNLKIKIKQPVGQGALEIWLPPDTLHRALQSLRVFLPNVRPVRGQR